MRRVLVLMIGLVLLVATPGIAMASPYPRPPGNQEAINTVIARALSQRGVPFTFGGGNAEGPTRGVKQPEAQSDAGSEAGSELNKSALDLGSDLGLDLTPQARPEPVADVIGFDASGLIVYSFAGVGVKMPRSSGEQYKAGAHVTPAQALPGDLIFYGPEGGTSVALFVGNGQMVEVTEDGVTLSPVRTDGMTPYLTRIIA